MISVQNRQKRERKGYEKQPLVSSSSREVRRRAGKREAMGRATSEI